MLIPHKLLSASEPSARPSLELHRLRWINALLALPAAASLAAGIHHATHRDGSKDFQWSAPHLALQHVDPYGQFLAHDPGHRILLSQVPNYLHMLYLLLLPFGALSFNTARIVWVACNCLFTVLLVLLLRRLYQLDRDRTLLLVLLMLISTPYRMALGNGQQALLELLLFSAAFLPVSLLWRGLALGLSYSKYSFSPPVFLFFLFRGRFRLLALSLLPPLAGIFLLWLIVHGNPVVLAGEPFAVSRRGVDVGCIDLMSLVRLFAEGRLSQAVELPLASVVGLLSSIVYTAWLARRRDIGLPHAAAALGTASLLFLTHLTYDFVFLALPLAAALRGPWSRVRIWTVGLIAAFWIGIKFVASFQARSLYLTEIVAGTIVIAVLLALVSSRKFFYSDPEEALATSRPNASMLGNPA